MQLLETTHSPPNSQSEQKRVLTSLELFAGAGGLALGTHAAGFKPLGLIEWDAFSVRTLRQNSQRVLDLDPDLILHTDARSVDYDQFAGKVDLLSGGPPCQPFSTSGRSLGPTDPRNMFPAFFDAVSVIMPNAILIENVKGLLRKKFQMYFSYILKRLQFPFLQQRKDEDWQSHYERLLKVNETDFADNEQFIVTFQLVNTADYGVPQRRERVFISAFRRDLSIETFHIQATNSKAALLIDQWITGAYWERHGVPPCNYLSSGDRQILDKLRQKLFPIDDKMPWRTVRDALSDLPTPVDRGNEEEIPNHIQHPGARSYPCHMGSHFDYPAKVLKAGTHGTPGGENTLRVTPEGDVRYFTTREAARLQTFPDNWHFHGTWGACIRQLGNAVPVEVARLFSAEIYSQVASVIEQRFNKGTHEKNDNRRNTSPQDTVRAWRN